MSTEPPFEDSGANDAAKDGQAAPRPGRPSIHPMYQQPPTAPVGGLEGLSSTGGGREPHLNQEDLRTSTTDGSGLPMADVLPYPSPTPLSAAPTAPRVPLASSLPGDSIVELAHPPSLGANGAPSHPLPGNVYDISTGGSAGIVGLSSRPPSSALPVSQAGAPGLPPYVPPMPTQPRPQDSSVRQRVQPPVGDWSDLDGASRRNPVPDEIKRRPWNWGAFLLTPIWCASNGAPVFGYAWDLVFLLALLAAFFYPEPFRALIVKLLMTACMGIGIYAGIRGNVLAWQNREFDGVEDFDRVQNNWALAGAGVALVLTVITVPILVNLRPIPEQKPTLSTAPVVSPQPQGDMVRPPMQVTNPAAPVPVRSEPYAPTNQYTPQPSPGYQNGAPSYPATSPAAGQMGGPPPASTQPTSMPPGQETPPQYGAPQPPVDNSGQQPPPSQTQDPTGGPPPDQSGGPQYPSPPPPSTTEPPAQPSTPAVPEYGGPPPSGQ